VTCSEDDDLIIFFSLLEAIVNVRTDIDTGINALALLKLHRNGQVVRQILDIINAVD
jgi:predicted acetyltransferase